MPELNIYDYSNYADEYPTVYEYILKGSEPWPPTTKRDDDIEPTRHVQLSFLKGETDAFRSIHNR
jgi:hypothetical protein